jgi:hypothetical protein
MKLEFDIKAFIHDVLDRDRPLTWSDRLCLKAFLRRFLEFEKEYGEAIQLFFNGEEEP